MTLEELQALWAIEGKVDITALHEASVNIPQLHGRWYKIYLAERKKQRILEAQLKVLVREKEDFYLNGPTEEQYKAGWELPPKGKILKSDVKSYVASDRHVIKLELKLGDQKDIVDFLYEVVSQLIGGSFSSRNTSIKNAIEYMKWTQGTL